MDDFERVYLRKEAKRGFIPHCFLNYFLVLGLERICREEGFGVRKILLGVFLNENQKRACGVEKIF